MSAPKMMTVLFETTTGTILAALTRTDATAAAPSPADLVGDALPLRGAGLFLAGNSLVFPFKDNSFDVPAEALSAADVPVDPGLLALPMSYGYDAKQKAARSLPFPQTATNVSVTSFTAAQVTVSTDANVSADTPVWVSINGASLTTPWVGTGTIASGSMNVVIGHAPFMKGDYTTLVLATGFLLSWKKSTL